VSRNHVNLLVEAVEFADDIDLDRAELAFKTTKEKLGAADAEVDVQAEEAAMARAANRMKVYRETHK
jgi:F0F1-type ATP synthase epsilon subunit